MRRIFALVCLLSLCGCGFFKGDEGPLGSPKLREEIKEEYFAQYGRYPSEWRIDVEVKARREGSQTL